MPADLTPPPSADEAWNAAIEAAETTLASLADSYWAESQFQQRAGHKTESLRCYIKHCGVKEAGDAVRALRREPPHAP